MDVSNLMSKADISEQSSILRGAITYRARMLKINAIYRSGAAYYSKEDADRIINFTVAYEPPPKLERFEDVIHLFKTLNDNRIEVISRMTGLSQNRVSNYVDKYLKQPVMTLGYVVFESRMNFDNFD